MACLAVADPAYSFVVIATYSVAHASTAACVLSSASIATTAPTDTDTAAVLGVITTHGAGLRLG